MRSPGFNLRLAVIILVFFLGAGLLFLLIISPLFQKVVETKAQIRANEAKLLEIAAEIANYKALSANLLKVSETKTALLAMFPAREEMLSLILGLESAVQRAGLAHKLVIADFKEKRDQNPAAKDKPSATIVSGLTEVEEIPYHLEVLGNYRGLADLFLYLENLPFVTVPDKLTASADQIQPVGFESLRNTGTATAKLDGVLFIKLNE